MVIQSAEPFSTLCCHSGTFIQA